MDEAQGGGEGDEGGGEVQPICIDTYDLFLIFLAVWNMDDDLIRLCLGWIQMQSSEYTDWLHTHLWCIWKFKCVNGRNAPSDPLT